MGHLHPDEPDFQIVKATLKNINKQFFQFVYLISMHFPLTEFSLKS